MTPVTTSLLVLLAVCILNCQVSHGKPISSEEYKDTEEILNEWNNDDSYYDDQNDQIFPKNVRVVIKPPAFVEHILAVMPTTTTTTRRPVYFPKTDIELGPLFEQVGKARRNEAEVPVDLPVPYIVWAKDPTGQEDKVNYWKKFYNTMYKVD